MTRDEAAEIIARASVAHVEDVKGDRAVRYGAHWHALENTRPGTPERERVDEAWTWFQAHEAALDEEMRQR